jgi:hypothetical protein
MLKFSLEKRAGIALLPSVSYYKCPFLTERNAYGHCLAFSLFHKVLYVWFAKKTKKPN